MLILVVEPEKLPEAREITGSLQEMQEIVGGMIQVLYPFPGEEIALVCSDEGKLLGLELNRGLRDGIGNLYDIICGTFFLCGAPADSDEFSGLTPQQMKRMEQRFHIPEIFVGMGGRIICLPME